MDGDSQETNQLDYALEKVMKNAVCFRCAWHIVAQGMKKSVLLGSRQAKDPKTDAIASTIQSWMYFWMQYVLESEDEYEMLVALKSCFVCSSQVYPCYIDLSTYII
jgi:hypothetical protein